MRRPVSSIPDNGVIGPFRIEKDVNQLRLQRTQRYLFTEGLQLVVMALFWGWVAYKLSGRIVEEVKPYWLYRNHPHLLPVEYDVWRNLISVGLFLLCGWAVWKALWRVHWLLTTVRLPYVFNRRKDEVVYGGKSVLQLTEIESVLLFKTNRPSEKRCDHYVYLVRNDEDQTLVFLSTSENRTHEEKLAHAIANFLRVEVIEMEPEKSKPSDSWLNRDIFDWGKRG